MRHSTLLLVALAACTEESEAPRVFDGEYRVSIVETSNTCGLDSLGASAPDITTRLDMFQRSDGLFDLRWPDAWVPTDFTFTAVELGDGSIRHGIGGANEVIGTISNDKLSLQLVARTVLLDGRSCEKHATVRGERRPMFSPDSVDGRYLVTIDHVGGTCPDGTTIAARGAWNMRMEVLPFRPDRTSVLISDPEGGMMRFWIEPIGRGGPVQLTRDVFFTSNGSSITPLAGTVEGTIKPDRVELAASISAKDSPSACTESYRITGQRWIPSMSSVEYRATYRMTDSCDPAYNVVYEGTAFAVPQADGRVDLIDNETQSTVSLDGANLTAPQAYRGTVTRDHTSYVVEDPYTWNGRDCLFTLAVDGTARY
jgi:hypothetical protein